jgi:hypothetical protein
MEVIVIYFGGIPTIAVLFLNYKKELLELL